MICFLIKNQRFNNGQILKAEEHSKQELTFTLFNLNPRRLRDCLIWGIENDFVHLKLKPVAASNRYPLFVHVPEI